MFPDPDEAPRLLVVIPPKKNSPNVSQEAAPGGQRRLRNRGRRARRRRLRPHRCCATAWPRRWQQLSRQHLRGRRGSPRGPAALGTRRPGRRGRGAASSPRRGPRATASPTTTRRSTRCSARRPRPTSKRILRRDDARGRSRGARAWGSVSRKKNSVAIGGRPGARRASSRNERGAGARGRRQGPGVEAADLRRARRPGGHRTSRRLRDAIASRAERWCS